MDWLTILSTAVAAASLAIAAVYLILWLRTRDTIWNLMFALLTIGIAAMAAVELWIINALTAEQYSLAVRWYHVPVFVSTAAFVALVHYRFDSDRLWIGQAAVILRGLSLIPNFVYPNLNYLEILELRRIEVLGEQISVVTGVPNPWMLLGQFSNLLLIIYIADAAMATWRKRENAQKRALSAMLLILAASATVHAVLGFWGFVDIPVIVTPYFIGVAIAMGIELSLDVLRAADLESKLRESRARLDTLSRAMSLREVTTAIAHEINQPLGVIHSNSEAAQMLLAQETPDLDEIRSILDDIIKADRRAADVVKRLRALAHRNAPEFVELDVSDVIAEAAGHMHDDFKRHDITLSVYACDERPPVAGDRILIVQVLLNLLANARDAVLENPRGRRRVELTMSADDRFVTVRVSDNGAGLRRNAEEIFDPFVTTKEKGLGMGLAIARSIVESHGGRIRAEAESGSGASFHVSLPRKSPV